jgi:uncharacterized protein (TIGR03435 family)
MLRVSHRWSLAAILIPIAAAQPAGAPEFDAATVKVSPPPPGPSININLGTALNGRVTLTNVTLSDAIKFAYGIVADAQLTGPDWISSGTLRYDIVGQAPAATPRDELLRMLQTLLADRLRLVLHREQRELRYVALISARTGVKILPTPPGTAPGNGPALPGRIVSPQMSMQTLAKLLSRFERQTVLDMTGLDGPFDIHLEWSPEDPVNVGGNEPTRSSPPKPALATAVQEQLGLRLEARKGPVEVLVVDSAEKIPAEN